MSPTTRQVVDDAILMNSKRSDYTFVFHNYFQARYAAMGLAILAAGNDDSRFDNLFSGVKSAIDLTLDFLGDGFPEDDLLGRGGIGGGWPEGYEYDRIASSFFLRLLLAWRSAGLEDYLSGSQYWQDKILWSIYGTAPDGSYLLGYEDNDFPIFLGEDRMRMTVLASEFRSGHARWQLENFLETIRNGHYSDRIHPYWDLIFFDTTVQPLEPDPLPTSRLIPGLGLALMRSSWDQDATYVHFHSGGWFTGHQHLAQGSFTVYRGRHLVIEPGVFVGSVDDHYLNWRMRTISHNCITVMDPDEVFVGPGNTILANDGGQQIQNWIHTRPNTVEDWRNQRELRETGKITAFQTHPTHDYLIGESGNAYLPGKVKRWCRQLLFIKPDWIVLCDLVETGNSEHLKTQFIHTPEEILINGNQASTPASGNPSMIVYSMLPQGAALETAGGPGKTFEYGGRNWTGPQAINGQFDVAWRLEVEAPPKETTIFLTALFIPDPVSGARETPAVSLIENTAQRVALSLDGGKYLVVFDPTAERSYGLSGPDINFPYPSCDFNGDGLANIVDVIALILKGRNNPDTPDVDRNGDGRFTIDDAIELITSIRSGKCFESSTTAFSLD